jgi:hypothetical protein
MKLFRVLPLVLIPFTVSAQDNDTKVTSPPASVSQTQDVTNTSEIKLPELNEEDLKALDAMDAFLKIYGDYSYASMERFIRGLQGDYKTIKEEARNDPTLTSTEVRAAEIYPDSILLSGLSRKGSSASRVAAKVREKGEARITTFLTDMGVDPKTAKNKDTGNGKKSVTKPMLEGFGKNTRAVKKSLEVGLPEGKCIAFTAGLNPDVTAAIRQGKLEPGIKIVDIFERIKL